MKIKTLPLAIVVCFTYLVTVSFQVATPLQGVWEYKGAKYGRYTVTAPKEVKLQKVYSGSGYQVLAIYPNGKTVKNEEGTYSVKNNIDTETQSYSNLTSSLKSKVMQYTINITNNKLTIKGKFSNKSPMEEYWQKIK